MQERQVCWRWSSQVLVPVFAHVQILKQSRIYVKLIPITTGSDLETSRKAQVIARQHEGLYFTAGVHPHNAKSCDASTLDALRELAGDERCVALGECGLDFNRNFSPPDVQERWFDEQVCAGPQNRIQMPALSLMELLLLESAFPTAFLLLVDELLLAAQEYDASSRQQ